MVSQKITSVVDDPKVLLLIHMYGVTMLHGYLEFGVRSRTYIEARAK